MEFAPWGKHWWLSQPDLTDTKQLTLVRVRMRPGAGHQFHYHPAREEIIYVLDGVAEQWVDREKRRLKAGEIAFIPKNVVHAIHNPSKKPMTLPGDPLAGRGEGPLPRRLLQRRTVAQPAQAVRLPRGRSTDGPRGWSLKKVPMKGAFAKLCVAMNQQLVPVLNSAGFSSSDTPFRREEVRYEFRRSRSEGAEVVAVLFNRDREALFSCSCTSIPEKESRHSSLRAELSTWQA